MSWHWNCCFVPLDWLPWTKIQTTAAFPAPLRPAERPHLPPPTPKPLQWRLSDQFEKQLWLRASEMLRAQKRKHRATHRLRAARLSISERGGGVEGLWGLVHRRHLGGFGAQSTGAASIRVLRCCWWSRFYWRTCFVSDGLHELRTSYWIGLLTNFSADSFIVVVFTPL